MLVVHPPDGTQCCCQSDCVTGMLVNVIANCRSLGRDAGGTGRRSGKDLVYGNGSKAAQTAASESYRGNVSESFLADCRARVVARERAR